MRVLRGAKVFEAGPEWREAIGSQRVIIDVGTGDGRYVYEAARGDGDSFYIGLDPDADAMAEYAFRAARKPARGGVANVLYVVASLEQLPVELSAMGDIVRVNFPWAGLLRGVIKPEPLALEALRQLLAPGGGLEIVFCYDPEHDKAALEGEQLPALDETYIEDVLRPAYELSGLVIEKVRRLTQEEAIAIPSTWGRRLLHGRPRSVFFIHAVGQL